MIDGITCCVACGWGKGSVPEEEIKAQSDKHGEYICKSCEQVFEGILQAPKDEKITIDKGYGSPSETVITEDNIYYFDGSVVADPNRSFIGFGGAWILIVKSYPTKYGAKNKAIVTNNLWHSRRIPPAYQKKMKDSGKVDSHVIWADKRLLAELRDTLSGIRYLDKETVK